MNRQEIFEWVKATYGTEPDYPWNDWNAVLRHKDNNKWYGVVMEVAESKLGLTGDKIVDLLNVKCDPILIGSLRQQKKDTTGLSFIWGYYIVMIVMKRNVKNML